MIGKRKGNAEKSSLEPDSKKQKVRPEIESGQNKLKDNNNPEEEKVGKKEEKKQEAPTRKSDRNIGKDVTYDIDKYLD
jgi:hypothetical protein